MPEPYIPGEYAEIEHGETTLEVYDTDVNGDHATVFHWMDDVSEQMMIVPDYGEPTIVTNEGHGWHGSDNSTGTNK